MTGFNWVLVSEISLTSYQQCSSVASISLFSATRSNNSSKFFASNKADMLLFGYGIAILVAINCIKYRDAVTETYNVSDLLRFS
jgi:hypothetical protein